MPIASAQSDQPTDVPIEVGDDDVRLDVSYVSGTICPHTNQTFSPGGNRLDIQPGGDIVLEPGTNRLGVEVLETSPGSTNMRWAAFSWLTLKCTNYV